ncbi:hypothetical protein EW026_g4486 [Hermanssonia centrifuga]|uniref:Aminotransferase class I/classII large domain-containing protein n=1 Tax=Hermanssonia centrifuga TaxID=98765 RepID=A0A4S4KGY5_9APHY|nr:hypothetical protein EW026_g4486 [Hermanssonia centrifuga]
MALTASGGEVNDKPLLQVLPDGFYTPRLSVMANNRTHDGIRDPANPQSEIPIELSQEELEVGLQYSPTVGLPALVDWAYGLQEITHGRKVGEGWKISIGNGSQDLIYKAITALVNPGDPVFVEAPVYAGVIPMFQTLQCEIIELETDSQGIYPESICSALENWPISKPKPKVLYTVPYGCNPTGTTATLERRLAVLELARRYDFLILEERGLPEAGRVIRFDSLSKILSSGIRLGFVSGPQAIVRAMDDHSTVANLQPNSLAQVIALSIFSRWGYKGFSEHTERVSEFYRKKRDVFQAAMERHLAGIAEWTVPEAGMFMWMTVITHSDGVPIVRIDASGEKGDSTTSPTHVLPNEFYTARLSVIARNRTIEGIRSMLPLEQRPGVISLLAGKPHSSTFPITSLNFTVRDPADPNSELPVQLSQEELELGLQYGPTVGIPALVDWFYGLQDVAHGRKVGEGWNISVGNGSQDLIYKAVTALVNPGDAVFVEAPVYAGVFPIFQTLGCEIIEIETDSRGICPASIRSALENWPTSKPKPKVLYTVPYGSNPTGTTATLERRLEILELARLHDFFILEDDPYHFLYYGSLPRPPSYFALERGQHEVGRVVRFDSLSKILSAGFRLGFVSGPEMIVQAMNNHTMASNLQPNSLSQVLALAVLSRWGYKGFMDHTTRVSQFYRQKRDVFQAAMEHHLAGIVEWVKPEAGMFMWFKLMVDAGDGTGDSNSVIRTTALERGVLALPGTVFYPNGRKSAYVRASFSQLDEEQVNEALKRLRVALLDIRT